MAIKRDEPRKEVDRLFLADCMLKSYNYLQMVELLETENKNNGIPYKDGSWVLGYDEIRKDCHKVLLQWRAERDEHIDTFLERELLKLDKIEQTMWDAWLLSTEGKSRTKKKKGTNAKGKVNTEEKQFEPSPGEVKYIERMQWCIDKRIEYLGFKTQKIDVTSKGKRIRNAGSVKITYGDLHKKDDN